MTFRTFFLITFLLSISLSITVTFFPNEVQNTLYTMNKNYIIDDTFIGLLSFIIAIVAYIGLILSYYYGYKKQKKIEQKKKKQEAERLNLQKIHAELQELRG